MTRSREVRILRRWVGDHETIGCYYVNKKPLSTLFENLGGNLDQGGIMSLNPQKWRSAMLCVRVLKVLQGL
jgi:hypothetical protein